jgi:hypothetical protein
MYKSTPPGTAARVTITPLSRKQLSSGSTPSVTTGIHRASHCSRSLASRSGSHRQADAEKAGKISVAPHSPAAPARITRPKQRRSARSQSLPDEVSLLRPEFADIFPTHKYGPFQGHQISSITIYAACLPASLLICLFSRQTDTCYSVSGCLNEYRHPTLQY